MWVSSLLSVLASVAKPLVLFFAYLMGKRAATTEIQAEQAKKDAELEKAYLDNRTSERTPDDVAKRMQDGSF